MLIYVPHKIGQFALLFFNGFDLFLARVTANVQSDGSGAWWDSANVTGSGKPYSQSGSCWYDVSSRNYNYSELLNFQLFINHNFFFYCCLTSVSTPPPRLYTWCISKLMFAHFLAILFNVNVNLVKVIFEDLPCVCNVCTWSMRWRCAVKGLRTFNWFDDWVLRTTDELAF